MGILLQHKVLVGYLILPVIIGSMIAVFFREHSKIAGIEDAAHEIHHVRSDINRAHLQITLLSTSGESAMAWDDGDFAAYQGLRTETDRFLLELKGRCAEFVHPGQIDSLRFLLESKEKHLQQIMEILRRQEHADSLLLQSIPSIPYKGPSKRKGLFGLSGKRKRAEDARYFENLQLIGRKMTDIYKETQADIHRQADSLETRNKELNDRLYRLITDMDRQTDASFLQKEARIIRAHRHSMAVMSLLAGLSLFLLGISYMIICHDIRIKAKNGKQLKKTVKELRKALKRNKELTDARQRTIRMVTHELRTPLTSITGYAGLLKGKADTGGRFVENILQSSARMASMLNSLLEFFRLDSGKEKVNPAPFRLQDVALSLQADFRSMAESKDLLFSVECETEAVLFGDKERVMQIGGNLLSNAIKFTRTGKVLLGVSFDTRMLTLVVEDTGDGMDEDEQERIFTAFERLSNAATQDGFGLGLSIVKHLVEMLGGTIALKSEKGKGSRFTVRIPMLPAETFIGKNENGLPQMNPGRTYSVIALDDNETVLSLFRDMYAEKGIHCDAFCNISDVMEAMRARNYDLLVTDLKMPEINGYEVLELMRSSHIGNSREIPVIVSTASGCCSKDELEAKGFSACLFKPFSQSELLEVSERCLRPGAQDTDRPDLLPLLAFGDKREMLDRIISETAKDMRAMEDAAASSDRERLDALTHRLRSSWSVIRADGPLRDLHAALHGNGNLMEGELQEAVHGVLLMGEKIMEQARKEKERYGKDNRG